MRIIPSPSPNIDDRAGGRKPDILLLHYTDMPTAEDARVWMCDPERVVSAHYLIDLDGTTWQLVDEEKRARHAGVSFWRGETDINSSSIGIEIQNTGHSHGYVPFPDAQIAAVAELCRDIIRRHDIPARNVLAHSDVAPHRKQDPDYLFPWAHLAAQGIGLWPQDNALSVEDAPAGDMMQMLGAFGYDTSQDETVLVTAFQRHFEPEAFHDGTAGTVSARTLARLAALCRLAG